MKPGAFEFILCLNEGLWHTWYYGLNLAPFSKSLVKGALSSQNSLWHQVKDGSMFKEPAGFEIK